MGEVVEYIAKDEISTSEQDRLDQLAAHISDLEHEANLTGLKLRLQQAEDLIEAFKVCTGRTPFEAVDDSARQRFHAWYNKKLSEAGMPFSLGKAWEFMQLRDFCKRRPAALKMDNIRVEGLVELSRKKLITGGKAGADVDPKREKIVTATLAKLKKRKNVTAADAKKAVYADLEAAGLAVYKPPPKKITMDQAETKVINLIEDLRKRFKRHPEEREAIKQFIINEAENVL